MVSVKLPVEASVNAPAPLLKARELKLQAASMSGVRRVEPAKIRAAVPLLSGALVQLAAVDHVFFVELPPFQVCASADETRAQKNSALPIGSSAMPIQPRSRTLTYARVCSGRCAGSALILIILSTVFQ